MWHQTSNWTRPSTSLWEATSENTWKRLFFCLMIRVFLPFFRPWIKMISDWLLKTWWSIQRFKKGEAKTFAQQQCLKCFINKLLDKICWWQMENRTPLADWIWDVRFKFLHGCTWHLFLCDPSYPPIFLRSKKSYSVCKIRRKMSASIWKEEEKRKKVTVIFDV